MVKDRHVPQHRLTPMLRSTLRSSSTSLSFSKKSLSRCHLTLPSRRIYLTMSYGNFSANANPTRPGELFGLHKHLARTKNLREGQIKKPVIGEAR